jgi:hypothetical protein
MVNLEEGLKKCRLCRRALPLCQFHRARPNAFSSRCKQCHGVGLRKCSFCSRAFIGKSGRKSCSQLCSNLLNAPTFLLCKKCGQVYGPVDHLCRRYCSKACAYAAALTGRKSIRKTITKARSAQSLLRYHVQAGHLVRPSVCEECKSTDRRIEGAHFNYDEPLRVRWLCIPCHRRWDKQEPKGATIKIHLQGRQSLLDMGATATTVWSATATKTVAPSSPTLAPVATAVGA